MSSGSSPRVRGTLPVRRGHVRRRRFIPACAGNSIHLRQQAARDRGSSPRVRGTRCPPGTTWARRTVHPRVCGELTSGSTSQSSGAGSSPRVRGTPPPARRRRGHERFIPACAGNSALVRASSSAMSVHPRVCGELVQRATPAGTTVGSSPRVRGTPVLAIAQHFPRRFIPACAGNSQIIEGRDPPPAGSSPRVRGTRSLVHEEGRGGPVHPRVCGELAFHLKAALEVGGSSPRVRGTR